MEHLQSLKKIFQDQLFIIPDYQRGYAWEKQQWQDLLDDLELLDSEQDHYTGTLVIHPEASGKVSDDNGDDYTVYNVVDGQQRLTTVSILLNELIKQFETAGDKTKADVMRTRYIATVRGGKPLPKLRLNRDTNDFYTNNIIAAQKDISHAPSIRSEARLAEAKRYFNTYFTEKRTVLGDSYPAWLEAMRTKMVSQMKLTVYVVPKASEVGVIFEVMNNRGKPLTHMERVKNYLLYVCARLEKSDGEELAEEVNHTWTYIYERIMLCGGFGWMEDYLLRYNWIMTQHYQPKYWNGYNSVKAKYSLKAYHDDLQKLRDDIRTYVSLLKKSCKAYCDIANPSAADAFDDIQDGRMRKEISEYSMKLIRLGTTATFAPLLMAVRLSGESGEKYLQVLKICELYAFRVFRMLELRANKGQSHFFWSAHEYFNNRLTFDGMYSGLHSLLTRVCPESAYVQEVDYVGDWYNWYGLKYLLYEYELHLITQNGYPMYLNWEVFSQKDKKDTVEHILPQTPDRPYWRKHWKKREINEALSDIGNLVVTFDNSSYGNKGFPDKKGKPGEGVCYANSPLFSEKTLCKYADWDYAAFLERRDKIADWMKERWYIADYASGTSVEDIGDDEDDTEMQ